MVIEPRTAFLIHKCFATELRKPASIQTLQSCIYTVKDTAMLQSHSQQTNIQTFQSCINTVKDTAMLQSHSQQTNGNFLICGYFYPTNL